MPINIKKEKIERFLVTLEYKIKPFLKRIQYYVFGHVTFHVYNRFPWLLEPHILSQIKLKKILMDPECKKHNICKDCGICPANKVVMSTKPCTCNTVISNTGKYLDKSTYEHISSTKAFKNLNRKLKK